MKHDYTNLITCPHCNHVFSDSWEWDNSAGEEVDCESCGKPFELEVHTSVQYSTKKVPCVDSCRTFGPTEVIVITAETCAQWNRERFLGRDNHVPHVFFKRICTACDDEHYSDHLPIGSPCPWDQQAAEASA